MGYKACYLLFYSSNIHSDIWAEIFLKFGIAGLPGGSVAVVKNLPANAGDMGLIPDLRKSHMLRSNLACAPQLLSLCSRVQEPHLLSPQATTTEARIVPMLHNTRSHHSEKSTSQ